MPRDRGFRDPKTLHKLSSEVSSILRRLESHQRNNAVIARIPFASHEEYQRRVDDAQKRHVRRQRKDPTDQALSANHGQTVCVKDNIITTRLPTSCASNILRGYAAPESATVVRLMEEAGMLVLAKTNMDEFGMGSHSLHSAFGPVTNGPEGAAITVGGSSGGSALAVATKMCHTAIGTDTGGSVRLPAAYLNLVGFKPSYGTISRNGVVPYANSLDTVGIIARTCLDVFLLFQILNVPDKKDPTCLSEASRVRSQATRRERLSTTTGQRIKFVPINSEPYHWAELRATPPLKKMKYAASERTIRARRIGVPAEYNISEMHGEVRDAWARTLSMLQARGHEIVPVSLPSTKQALSAYYVLAPAEASSNLAKYDGVRYGSIRNDSEADEQGVLYSSHRGKNFGDEVKRRILLGSYSLSAGAMDNYFIQAQKVRRKVQDDFNQIFRMAHPLLAESRPVTNGVDFIICPTAPTIPPSAESLKKATPLESYINDVFTVPASLAGLPAISVPAPRDLSWPKNSPERAIGMQIIGQYGEDYSVIQFAKKEIEDQQDWSSLRRLVESHTS